MIERRKTLIEFYDLTEEDKKLLTIYALMKREHKRSIYVSRKNNKVDELEKERIIKEQEINGYILLGIIPHNPAQSLDNYLFVNEKEFELFCESQKNI